MLVFTGCGLEEIAHLTQTMSSAPPTDSPSLSSYTLLVYKLRLWQRKRPNRSVMAPAGSLSQLLDQAKNYFQCGV